MKYYRIHKLLILILSPLAEGRELKWLMVLVGYIRSASRRAGGCESEVRMALVD